MTELTQSERELVLRLMDGPQLIARYNPKFKQAMCSGLVKRTLIAVVVYRPVGTIYALTNAGREALKANPGVIPDIE